MSNATLTAAANADAGAETDSLSLRAAALANFVRRLSVWDFPADAVLQISVVAGRSVTVESGGPVVRQASHADLFIGGDDAAFIEAALERLLASLMTRARRAAALSESETVQ